MKKLLLLILALALCIATFAACTTKKDPDKGTEKPSESQTEADEESTPLDDALSYIHQLYKDMKTSTVASYDLVKVVTIGDETFEVVWTIEGTDKVTIADKDDNNVTVVIPELGNDEIAYTLKATITKGDKTVSREYSHSVPKFAVNTFADYAAADDDATLIVEGIISGVISKSTGSSANGLYIQDINGEGGYYVYNLTEDPSGTLEVGMKVQVSGVKDTYNGTYELVQASVKVLDGNKVDVTPVDYTEIIKNAASLSDDSLVGKQGMLVTIKGVTIGEVDSSSGYYYFSIGNHSKVYLRISSSNNPTTSEALAKIKENFSANYGNVADVTGVISIYSGNFYLSPVSENAFANFTEPERDAGQRAEFELNSIKFDSKITSDKVLDLIAKGTKYDDVAIAWTVEGEGATLADNKLTIKIPDNGSTITLKATATCEGETKTAEWTIALSKSLTSIKDAIDLGSTYEKGQYTDDKYLIGGVITEIQSDVYGNVIISDGFNSILVYGLYDATGATRYDALETKPAVGDYIVVLGVVGKYNDAQVKSGWIITHVKPSTIAEATTIGGANSDYTTEKYVTTGTITEFYGSNGTTYGNVYIKDAEGNQILVYGLYSATGETRYDKLETKPEVGDTITILGVLGNYNGTAQFKNAWLIGYTASGAQGGTDTPACEHTEVEHMTVAATCTTAGKNYDKCKACGAEINVEAINALGHDLTTPDCENAAKCQREGCNYTEGEALGHKWIPATCTTPKTCSVCAKKDGEALGHLEEYKYDDNQHWKYCKNEGCTWTSEKEDHVKPKGSDVCSVCGEGCVHENTTHETKPATCTSAGREYDKCTACGTELNITVISQKDHDLKDATCTEPKSCKNCDYTEGEALGHDEEDLAAVEETCTTDGLKAGEKCKRCGTVTVAQETIPAGHKWVDATCTAPKTCSRCNTTEGEALGHERVENECTRCHLVWTTISEIGTLDEGTNVVVTGLVKVINTAWSTQYNNISVTIYDDDGNSFYVYRLGTSVTRGDTITITGTIGTNNGSKCIAAGATATVDSHTDLPIEYISMSIPDILNAADNTYVTFTGTVTSIKTAWDASYGNISVYVRDDDGNEIYLFRLATQVALCDKITVKGMKSSYYGAAQIGAGATAEIASEKNHYVKANCLKDVTCPCGEKTITATGTHSYKDEICEICGAIEGTTTITVEIADYATEKGWTNATQYSKIDMDSNITVAAAGGSNTGKYYTSGNQWRIYSSESATITIAAADGKTIKSVKVTYTSYESGSLTYNSENVTSNTVIDVNGSSITLSLGSAGQVRVTAIEVIYY